MAGMTSGRVTRAWAAWHHPRWYREQVARADEREDERDDEREHAEP
jgi:cytochrome b subunit of formate dehydrogenase